MTVTTTIQTARCILRHPTEDDVDNLVALDSDPAVMRYVPTLPNPKREEMLMRIKSPLAKGTWVVEESNLLNGPVFVGLAFLHRLEDWGPVELAGRFVPAYQGMGFAQEVSEALIDYAFNELDEPKLCGVVHRRNMPAIAVLKHFGFERKGEMTAYGSRMDYYELER